MVLLQIREFKSMAGIDQIATTWEIASDQNFNTILESKKVTEHIYSHYSDIKIPVGVTYYARALREFADTSLNYYTYIGKITNNYIDIDSMVSVQDVLIDVPVITVNTDEYKDPASSKFHIYTSGYRGSGDGHLCTHWIMLNLKGKKIFHSLYDQSNLVSIEVNKTPEMANITEFVIYAIHVSSNSVESVPGKLYVSTSDYKFDILINTLAIVPNQDFEIDPILKSGQTSAGISKAELFDPTSGKIVKNDVWDAGANKIKIPGMYLSYDATYWLDIYCTDTKENEVIRRVKLKVNPATYNNIRDLNYKYDERLIVTTTTMRPWPSNVIGSIPVSTICLRDNSIDVPQNQHSPKKMFLTHLELLATPPMIKEYNNISNNKSYFETFAVDNHILVDDLRSDGKAQFSVVEWNNNWEKTKVIAVIPREDETDTLAKHNSIVYYNRDVFYYVPVEGPGKLRKLSLSAGTVTDVIDMPAGYEHACIVKLPTDALMFIGKQIQVLVLDMKTMKFTKGAQLPYRSFMEDPIRTVLLANGDTLIFKTANPNNSTEPDAILFKYATQTFKDLAGNAKFNKFYPEISVLSPDKKVGFVTKVTAAMDPTLDPSLASTGGTYLQWFV